MRTWLIGEAPAVGQTEPFVSRSGDRLRECMGTNDLSSYFHLENVMDQNPGRSKKGKGHAFDVTVARNRVKTIILPQIQPDDRLILVGGRVARAFRMRGSLEVFEWGTVWASTLLTCPRLDEVPVCMIPHPSGVNRWWNEPENHNKMRAFLRFEARRSAYHQAHGYETVNEQRNSR